MDIQQILALLSRWFHVIPAMILVGGTLFLRFSFVPAANESSVNDELRESIRRRWAKLVMLSVLFLLISGFYNAYLKAIGYQLGGNYLTLLVIKILLAFFVFYLAAVMSGRSNTAKKFREKEIFWLNILCVAMIGIVAIAGWMKLSPEPIKQRTIEQAGLLQHITTQQVSIVAQTSGMCFHVHTRLGDPGHNISRSEILFRKNKP